jgi:AcrR family transcriptional regulator
VPRPVREEQILGLAEQLFAEHGYEGASMDELARRAGVSKPVVYDIVGSKETLFHRCFERAGDELARAMTDAAAPHTGDARGLLQSTAIAFLHFIEHHDQAWAVLDAGGRTESHLQKIRARQAQFTAAVLRALGADAEPSRLAAVAFMLNGAFEALAHWRREHPDTDDAAAAEWLVKFTLPGVLQLLPSPGTGGS